MAATIGIVAGEASGDNLGAGLMAALRGRLEGLRFVGIGGEAMLAQGLEPLGSMAALAVNGFSDPLVKLPQILGTFTTLRRRFLAGPPDVFVGVDFNVFNLSLERRLKRRGVPTVHYVSPSVYAWRPGRVKRINRSADRLLALFPFEKSFYADTNVDVTFVGHPLADAIGLEAGSETNRRAAREALGLDQDETIIALLPGSRDGEIRLMLDAFLDAAQLIRAALPEVSFVVPCPRPSIAGLVQRAVSKRQALPVLVHAGVGRLPLTACNAALVKSGTGTLEAMLLRRPMVMSYRLGPLAWKLARRLVHTDFVALPNILAGRALVPELLQDRATPSALAEKLLAELDKSVRRPEYLQEFAALHRQLQQNANERAADVVAAVLARKNTTESET